jgi:hypothetical protein
MDKISIRFTYTDKAKRFRVGPLTKREWKVVFDDPGEPIKDIISLLMEEWIGYLDLLSYLLDLQHLCSF